MKRKAEIEILESENSDLRQVAFKLTNELSRRKDNDIEFLKEMQMHAKKAYENRDVASYEMLIKMIEDWIHELSIVKP